MLKIEVICWKRANVPLAHTIQRVLSRTLIPAMLQSQWGRQGSKSGEIFPFPMNFAQLSFWMSLGKAVSHLWGSGDPWASQHDTKAVLLPRVQSVTPWTLPGTLALLGAVQPWLPGSPTVWTLGFSGHAHTLQGFCPGSGAEPGRQCNASGPAFWLIQKFVR